MEKETCPVCQGKTVYHGESDHGGVVTPKLPADPWPLNDLRCSPDRCRSRCETRIDPFWLYPGLATSRVAFPPV